jgi:hypothetical protein
LPGQAEEEEAQSEQHHQEVDSNQHANVCGGLVGLEACAAARRKEVVA